MKNTKLVGELLREKREEKGLLLRHVSAEFDIDTAILSKIERSERKATKDQTLLHYRQLKNRNNIQQRLNRKHKSNKHKIQRQL